MNNKVIRMINSYTKKRERDRAQTQGENQVSRKRTMVFGGLMLVICAVLLIIAMGQKSENGTLSTELADRETALEERQDESRDLEQQITQLNDDNYIMRIARSEFFMSEEGEIIFNFSEGSGDEAEENSSNSSNSEE